MPSAPETPRRSSNNRRSVPVTPKADDNTPARTPTACSVKDRIRQWQDQDAALAASPSNESLRPAEEVPRRKRTSRRGYEDLDQDQIKTDVDVTTLKRSGQNRGDRRNGESTQETRSSSTPRRRVTSDGHWKATRPQGEPRSAQSAPRREVRKDADEHRSPPDLTSAREEREERRRKRRERRLSAARQAASEREREIYGDTRPSSHDNHLPADAPTPQYDNHSDVDYDVAADLERPISPVEPLRRRSRVTVEDQKDDGRHRRRSRYADTLNRTPSSGQGSFAGNLGSLKSKTGSIFNRAKEVFSRSEAVTAPSPRVPSIEAWLNGQPDPFVDGDLESEHRADPTRKKSAQHQSLREGSIEEAIQDDRGADAGDDKRDQPPDSSRRRRSRKSATPLDEAPNSADTPPYSAEPQGRSRSRPGDYPESLSGGLRRRGARASRTPNKDVRSSKTRSSPLSPRQSGHLPNHAPPEYREVADTVPEKNLNSEKPCPPTGPHRLSTIASVETFQSMPAPPVDPDLLATGTNGLKRRLTTHEDLMSVLSLPRAGKSLRGARSTRSLRRGGDDMSLEEVQREFSNDEAKYLRELRTLVDGVIPVLLKSVLSKSDSAAAAGLFASSSSARDDLNFTKPIVDMGVALERLKSIHSRGCSKEVESLMSWAQSAHKAYSDYLQAWRLGFQDVVVNLAPADDVIESDHGMARDQHGDIVNAEGKKVDVAYLLKRPLVRIKNMSKLLSKVADLTPSSRASQVAELYADLVSMARRRSNEEQARLEDEAAANIDTTKTRDVQTLAVLRRTKIKRNRNVRARDCFSMTLHHSTGQRVDCRVELFLRDDPSHQNSGGDLLLCEVDETGRWLFFPPIEINWASARLGETSSDLVVMIRGSAGHRQEWHELLSLRADDAEAALEWVQMLGSDPIPPQLNRSPSFIERQQTRTAALPDDAVANFSSVPLTRHWLSARDVEVPIGEPSLLGTIDEERPHTADGIRGKPFTSDANASPAEGESSGLRRRNPNEEESSPRTPSAPEPPRRLSRTDEASRARMSSADTRSPSSGNTTKADTVASRYPAQKLSSTPSKEPPTVSRARQATESKSVPTTPLNESIRDQWAAISGSRSKEKSSRDRRSSARNPLPFTEDVPTPPTHSNRHSLPSLPAFVKGSTIPISPLKQTSPSPLQKLTHAALVLTPNGSKDQGGRTGKRRSSSPLKHEYAPSSASETSGDCDSDDSIMGVSPETSDDGMSENGDIPMPLLPAPAAIQRKGRPPPSSYPTKATTTLAPSDSASQAPYRSVPSASSIPDIQPAKTVAMVCCWSEKGTWEALHRDECSIVISPGLIEAYERAATPSKGLSKVQPLVAFELTPLVPLRRGTAIDISIRSPPTERSKIRKSNNVMFRSRSAEECEALYAMINHARINNPTYIALQNARPSYQPPVTFNTGAARHSRGAARTKSGSWFGFGSSGKRSSYRASSAPIAQSPSVGGVSESSIGSLSSAFSALHRFSTGGPDGAKGMFNLNRSSVTKKNGRFGTSGSTSLYSSSSGTTGTTGSGTPSPAQSHLGIPASVDKAAGVVNNMKIRFYVRESAQRWRDLGAARLTISPATDARNSTAADSASAEPPFPPSTHGPASGKRVVVIGKPKTPDTEEKTLLDAVLGENCFERIARTGIAVNVWEEHEVMRSAGGVVAGKGTMYMVQCRGEAEAGWVFGLVGRLRY